MKISIRAAGVLATLAGASVLTLAPYSVAFAQQDDDKKADDQVLEEIVTTGSRIRRDDFSSTSPLTVMDGQAILEQGVSNLGEALRDQAAMGTGGFNQSSILSGGGATSIDLRNLGQSRVLVLINGRRVASFADALQNQAADLSFVPTAMVDRVEILRDGASAVYGSDAITGVVNVILKKDFEGVEASVNTGASSESDGESYGASLTMGTSTDRGNFVAGVEWRRQNGVKQVDRAWAFPSISSLGVNGANNGSFYSPGGYLEGLASGNGFCTQPKAMGGDEVTDVYPNCVSFSGSQNVSNPDKVVMNRYDYALAQDLIVPNEVVTASLYGNYKLTDYANAFVEMEYSNRQGTTHLDGNPGAIFVAGTNPNNPLGEDAAFYFRPSSTIGPRTQDYESTTIRMVAGLDGDLPIGDGWYYEASLLYTEVNADLVTNYTWNLTRFERISDPAACAADFLCASAVNPSGALDTARPGNWTADEIDYLRQGAQAVSKFDTFGGQAFVSGPIFQMPAGSANMAFGVEERMDTGYAKPDSVTSSGESVANQTYPTKGDLSVKEVFTEFDLPLVSDTTGFQDLSLNLQWRYSDYDTFGGEDVYRVGLNWQITDWLRVRGNVSTAYRAPQVTDLYSGGVTSYDFITDPCDASQSGIVPTDNAWQNCVLDGIADPATFNQIAGQYEVLAGGNENLGPETADTNTYGIVVTPGGALEGLQVALDFWDISVDNLITRPTSDSVLDDCYNGPVGLTDPNCDFFDGRDPVDGTPINFRNALINEDNVKTHGYDLSINYAFDAGSTSWNIGLNGTHVAENTFYPYAGGADDRGSIPDNKINTRVDMYLKNWTFSWLTRYIGSMEDPRYDGNNSFGYHTVDSYLKHDIRVAYDWDHYRLLFGIANVTDEDPPYVFATGNNTDTFLYDVFGRYWYARVTYSM